MNVAPRPAILVVEDQYDVRRLVADTLRREGYLVEEAADGAEALPSLDPGRPVHRPGLIVLDLSLPEVDGLTVLHHVATLGPPPPVIAMSADRDLLAAARAAGVQATLSKPFGMGELLDLVEQLASGLMP